MNRWKGRALFLKIQLKLLQPEGKEFVAAGGGATAPPFCLLLLDHRSSQGVDPQCLEDKVLFTHPGSHLVCKLLLGQCTKVPASRQGVWNEQLLLS
jgi:hypothetical protein